MYLNEVVLDENNNEIFINHIPAKKILVYDFYGKFKRSLRYCTEDAQYYTIFNYDRDNLICYDGSGDNKNGEKRGSQSYYFIISKQDGSITQEIHIPFKEFKSQTIKLQLQMSEKETASVMYSTNHPIIPYHDNWILVESSSDTVYKYLPDNHLIPIIVRTPPIQSMDIEVFLYVDILTDRYCFMEIVKKEFDFEKNSGFPITNLMYDKQEKKIYEYMLFDNDISRSLNKVFRTGGNDGIAYWRKIEASFLVDVFKKGELKGKLKEIAAKLDEDDNPVIVLIKHKGTSKNP